MRIVVYIETGFTFFHFSFSFYIYCTRGLCINSRILLKMVCGFTEFDLLR
jgi:hypothetical protein